MLQQTLAVAACPVMAVCLYTVLRQLHLWRLASSGSAGAALIIVILLSGVILGYYVPRLSSRGLELARWAWVAPSCVFLIFFAGLARASGIPFALAAYFNPGDADSEGLVSVLVTFPVASAFSYSMGAVIGFAACARERKKRTPY